MRVSGEGSSESVLDRVRSQRSRIKFDRVGGFSSSTGDISDGPGRSETPSAPSASPSSDGDIKSVPGRLACAEPLLVSRRCSPRPLARVPSKFEALEMSSILAPEPAGDEDDVLTVLFAD